jgi:hypothetical protein
LIPAFAFSGGIVPPHLVRFIQRRDSRTDRDSARYGGVMRARLPSSVYRPAIGISLLLCAGTAQALTFLSPMGEPFRSPPGEKPPEEKWFEQADRNGDGRITRAEFLADAGRFFQLLDVNHDNEIGPEEIDRYEQDVAPEVRTDGFDGGGPGEGHHGGGGGARRHGRGHGTTDEDLSTQSSGDSPRQQPYDSSGEGASRYSYLDLPEPVTAADTNFNRGVSPQEFAAAANARFDLLDANQDGVLTRDELPRLGGAHPGRGLGRHGGGHRPPPPSRDGGPNG